MNLFETQIPLVGDPSRVHLLERVMALAHSETKLLDAGCGTCSLWKPLMGQYEFELWGVDIDEERVRIARETLKDEVRIKVGDVHSLSQVFPISFFDIVISTQLFYQIRNLKRALQEINRILKPEGKLLFTTELARPQGLLPCLRHKLAQHSKTLLGKSSNYIKRHDEKELSTLLRETGYEVEEVGFYHIPPLKFIHNRIILAENKNKVMHKWLELEEELLKDTNFLAQAKVYCRNLFIEATKRHTKGENSHNI